MIGQIAEVRLLVEDGDHQQRIRSAYWAALRQSLKCPYFVQQLSITHQLSAKIHLAGLDVNHIIDLKMIVSQVRNLLICARFIREDPISTRNEANNPDESNNPNRTNRDDDP